MKAVRNSVQTTSARLRRALAPFSSKLRRFGGRTRVWFASAPKSPLRMVLIIVVGCALLAGIGYAGYNYVYIPNNPDLLWSRALENTGKGTDMLLKESDKKPGTSKVDGTYTIDAASVHVDGSFSAVGDDQNATGHFDVGSVGLRVNTEFAASKVKDSTNPDVYLKVDGLKGIGGLIGMNKPELAQAIDQLNGQWISIDHTYLDTLNKKSGGQNVDITEQEVMDIVRKVQEVNKQYLFTADTNKAILKRNGDPIKEDHNNRKTYHYKVGLDKAHTRQYVTELKQTLSQTKVPQLVSSKEYDEGMQAIIASTDKINESSTADVWVDRQTRLIRSVRFTDAKKSSDYIEFGLNYNGGSELPFYLTAVATEDGNGRADVTFVYNMKDKSSKTHLEAQFATAQQKGQTFNMLLDMTTSSSDEKFDFKKPDNAKPLRDVLSEFEQFTANPQVRGASTDDSFLNKLLTI